MENIVFKGLKPCSTTVTAYCENCGEPIKKYLQEKCTACGTSFDWTTASDSTKWVSSIGE